VSSEDGLDEMSTAAPTRVVEVNGDAIERYTVSAGDVGLGAAPEDAVAVGTPDLNARVTRAILGGESSAHADLAYLNAGAAIYAAGRADTLAEGVDAARDVCTNGAAAQTLDAFVDLSAELAG
jgi:anthranilate phosphoribosyltransferase